MGGTKLGDNWEAVNRGKDIVTKNSFKHFPRYIREI